MVAVGAGGCAERRYDPGPEALPTTRPPELTAPPPPAQAAPPTTYVLVSGDTLSGVAARFGTTVDALMAVNELDDPTSLLAGDSIVVPPPTTTEPEGPGTVFDGFDADDGS